MLYDNRVQPCPEGGVDVDGEQFQWDKHGKVEFDWITHLNYCAIKQVSMPLIV